MTAGSNIHPALYPKIIDGIPSGMIISDKEGNLIYWNHNATVMLPTEKLDTNKSEWVDMYGVFHADRTIKFETEELPLARALRGETVYNEKVFILNEKTGPEGRYLKISTYPVYDEDNNLMLAVALLDDCTQEQMRIQKWMEQIDELITIIKDNIQTYPSLTKNVKKELPW